MQMTVNRESLIEALTAKQAEVTAEEQAKVDEARAKMAEAESSTTVADWLEKIKEQVEDGRLIVSKGRSSSYEQVTIHVGPSREAQQDFYGGRGKPSQPSMTINSLSDLVPEFPRGQNEERLESLRADVQRAEGHMNAALTPYAAALQLLNMSDDEKVGIDQADYHGLLGGAPAAPQKRTRR